MPGYLEFVKDADLYYAIQHMSITLKNPENLGGVVLFGVIKVMVHLPHLKNPYNPHKFLHLQIEFGSFKIRIPLGKRVK